MVGWRHEDVRWRRMDPRWRRERARWRREDVMTEPQRPTEDPTARLSPTARKLVVAARRLLARGGYEALTVEAVAAEAGAYRDSVRYYFGSKAAFVAAVVDSLSHDQSLSAVAEIQTASGGGERVHGLVAGDRRLVDDRAAFRDFFAILPHVVLEDELRERVAALYDWYRDLYVEGLGDATAVDESRLRAYASLMVAMTDGLAVQRLLDPDRIELGPLFELWESMLRRALLSGGE
jgi:AcrR family transcriptional regulator